MSQLSAGSMAKAESMWNVLALRLNLTGEHCGWFKVWQARALDAATRETWEAAFKVICVRCELGKPVELVDRRGQWEHTGPGNPRCDAQELRARAAEAKT